MSEGAPDVGPPATSGQQVMEDSESTALTAINANMSRMTTLLEKIIGLQTAANAAIPVGNQPDLELSGPQPKRSRLERDDDELSLTASDDDLNGLFSESSVTPNNPELQSPSQSPSKDDHNEFLSSLESEFGDVNALTGPAVSEQLAQILTKRWGNSLTREKIDALAKNTLGLKIAPFLYLWLIGRFGNLLKFQRERQI